MFVFLLAAAAAPFPIFEKTHASAAPPVSAVVFSHAAPAPSILMFGILHSPAAEGLNGRQKRCRRCGTGFFGEPWPRRPGRAAFRAGRAGFPLAPLGF